MDPNEAIIDAEASVEQRELSTAPFTDPHLADSHHAEHAALVADCTEDGEETPLLSKSDSRTAERNGVSEQTAGSETRGWPDGREFQHLPWWKRPSVCDVDA